MIKKQIKKLMSATANRFASLNTNDQTLTIRSPQKLNTINCEKAPIRANLPPPIIVRGVLDFIGFRNELIRLVGSENFLCKSTTKFNNTNFKLNNCKKSQQPTHNTNIPPNHTPSYAQDTSSDKLTTSPQQNINNNVLTIFLNNF